MEKEGTVLILMGPMGCGKTAIGKLLSRKLGWPFYDGDDFHPKTNVDKMRKGISLTDVDRKPWLERLHDKIKHWHRHKESVVLACSALKQTYRDMLGIDQEHVKIIYLKGSYELLRRRVEQREHPYMNTNLLKNQLNTLEEPSDGLWVDISPVPEKIVSSIIESLGLAQE